MKEQTFKPVMHNSYKCDNTVVRVNEYSTISAEWVSQMVAVDFPSFYNCIRVTLSSDPEFLETLLEDFVYICEKKFTVVLIQRVGIKDALISVFSPKNMHYIHSELFHFERFYKCGFDYELRY